mmetsp:Transcript_17073/g.17142  ORF Transcript_17073/g.17142 Transcript_17073/m.17142 type:complete len:201 (+) Transcript_17073:44-646(+)
MCCNLIYLKSSSSTSSSSFSVTTSLNRFLVSCLFSSDIYCSFSTSLFPFLSLYSRSLCIFISFILIALSSWLSLKTLSLPRHSVLLSQPSLSSQDIPNDLKLSTKQPIPKRMIASESRSWASVRCGVHRLIERDKSLSVSTKCHQCFGITNTSPAVTVNLYIGGTEQSTRGSKVLYTELSSYGTRNAGGKSSSMDSIVSD